MKLQPRVLLVDDTGETCAAMSRVLKCIGFDVAMAENGQAAHDRAMVAMEDGKPFDLILMDMQMPVMDGFEATALLRAHGYCARIAALTARNEARDQCLTMGCDDFATKPISFEGLRDLVQRNILA